KKSGHTKWPFNSELIYEKSAGKLNNIVGLGEASPYLLAWKSPLSFIALRLVRGKPIRWL
ncbi:MAG: hypothetical protein AAF992_10205, partial [Bacteroidota bacterium]